jgi:selenocysteine lyase/cysteine desulfurase
MGRVDRTGARTAAPTLVGAEVQVPLVSGRRSGYVDLDYAASTSALTEVANAVEAFLPWYSSVHRGAGFKSLLATAAYEGARQAVRDFFHARSTDAVIFVRNTTDAINLLASALPPDSEVLAFDIEHHANMLPWRRPELQVRYLPASGSPGDALAVLEDALRKSTRTTRLVAITGASNVTGEVWPVSGVVALAHRYGARVLLDGAQLAAHYPVDLEALGVDFFGFSAHKMYAPFGIGALIGPTDWLSSGPPFIRGGGAVDFVTLDSVLWSALPERQEAGSPNVVGAVALGTACRSLARYGMDRLSADELALAAQARRRLAAVPGVELYALWPMDTPRLGIFAFNVLGFEHNQIAAILSAEYGIGVRHGCFCAHPLMLHLLHVADQEAVAIRHEIAAGNRGRVPGAVRASLGIGTTLDDIDRLCAALEEIVTDGPKWSYRLDTTSGEYVPDPETRPWPSLSIPLAPSRPSRHEVAGMFSASAESAKGRDDTRRLKAHRVHRTRGTPTQGPAFDALQVSHVSSE